MRPVNTGSHGSISYPLFRRNICRFQDADDLYFCNILQKDDVPSAKARRITMQQAPDAVADLSVIGREVHIDGHILPLPVVPL